MSKEAILCVDDESILLIALKHTLKNNFGDRYRYETALNVEQAWEIINDLVSQNIKIVMIITDWLMPGVKGDEFLVQVYKKFPEIKSIMITGQASQEVYNRVKHETNLIRFFTKPWSSDELLKCIKDNIQ